MRPNQPRLPFFIASALKWEVAIGHSVLVIYYTNWHDANPCTPWIATSRQI